MHEDLVAEGALTSLNRVARLMARHGVQGRPRKKRGVREGDVIGSSLPFRPKVS
jgi:hypothetical protein